MFFGCDMKYGRCYSGPTDSLPMFNWYCVRSYKSLQLELTSIE